MEFILRLTVLTPLLSEACWENSEFQGFHWGHVDSELILSGCISKIESHVEFSLLRAKESMVGMCVPCTFVCVCGVGAEGERKEMKGADQFIERGANCTCKVLLISEDQMIS